MNRYITRRALVACVSGLAAALGLAGAGYATGIEPNLRRVTRHRVSPAGWPIGRTLRIALLADFHANRSNMGEAAIASVVEQTNALSPDLTLLLGDYCSQDPGSLAPETVAGLLAKLTARHGVHAVQGNHDWTDDRAALRAGGPTRTERALRAAGISLLEDAAIPAPGIEGLWIAGIASEYAPASPGKVLHGARLDAARTATLARMLGRVPADARVVLMAHEPDIFATDLDRRIALVVSGHTHGGQVRLFGWSPWIPSRYGLRYAYGHVRERGRDLVVSGGLGSHFVAGRPLRIGMPPEIVLVEVEAHAEAV